MCRSRVHGIVLGSALALASVAACGRQPLEPGYPVDSPGGRGGGAPGRAGSGGTGGKATGGTMGAVCATFNSPAGMVRSNILILLDASRSMNQNADNMTCDGGCGAGSKWAQATAAINAIVTDSKSPVNWGLKWFPDAAGCAVSNGVTVPVGNATSAITTAIASRTSPDGNLVGGGNTPTTEAVVAAASYLNALTDEGPKFILLLTDGASNCVPGDTLADDSARAVQAIAQANARGIPTFVVGIATAGGPAEARLNDMAVAGGRPRTAMTPSYYPAASVAELTSGLQTLLGTTPACVFNLPPPPVGSGYPPIGVRLDGVELPRDTGHSAGWDFTGAAPPSVEIYGPACDDVRAGKIMTVSIVFFCTN